MSQRRAAARPGTRATSPTPVGCAGVGRRPQAADGPSPLAARGVLAGSRTREGERRTTRSNSDAFQDTLYGAADFNVVDRVGEVAAERGVPSAQVALAWLLHRPGVTAPIVGATRLGHLQDALAAEELELSQDEMRRLEEPYVPHPVLGHS
jgi:1-deoxyxylulose-5-phosphate synthase